MVFGVLLINDKGLTSSWQLKAWWKKTIYQKTWFCCHSCHLFPSAITEPTCWSLQSSPLCSRCSSITRLRIQRCTLQSHVDRICEWGWNSCWVQNLSSWRFNTATKHRISLFLCQMGIICYPFYAPLHPLSLLQQRAGTSESYLIYPLQQKHHNPFEHEKTVQIRVSLFLFYIPDCRS